MMKTDARRITGLALAVFLAVGPAIQAGENGERPQGRRDQRLVELQRRLAELQDRFQDWRRETAERLERWWAEHREDFRRENQFEEGEWLDHPLQLVFELASVTAPPLTVVTSTTRFAVETNYEDAGEGMHIKVEGTIEPIENKPNSYRLHFDAGFDMASAQGRSHQSCRGVGSVVVKEGRSTSLLTMGDMSLLVKVTRVEGEPADQD